MEPPFITAEDGSPTTSILSHAWPVHFECSWLGDEIPRCPATAGAGHLVQTVEFSKNLAGASGGGGFGVTGPLDALLDEWTES